MAPKNHRLLSFLIGGVILTIVSCEAPSSSQVQLTLPGGIWEQSNILNLSLPVPDTSARYDAFLDLRLTTGYAYSYLSISLNRSGKGTPFGCLWLDRRRSLPDLLQITVLPWIQQVFLRITLF